MYMYILVQFLLLMLFVQFQSFMLTHCYQMSLPYRCCRRDWVMTPTPTSSWGQPWFIQRRQNPSRAASSSSTVWMVGPDADNQYLIPYSLNLKQTLFENLYFLFTNDLKHQYLSCGTLICPLSILQFVKKFAIYLLIWKRCSILTYK